MELILIIILLLLSYDKIKSIATKIKKKKEKFQTPKAILNDIEKIIKKGEDNNVKKDN